MNLECEFSNSTLPESDWTAEWLTELGKGSVI
jgi:hypothetical protein